MSSRIQNIIPLLRPSSLDIASIQIQTILVRHKYSLSTQQHPKATPHEISGGLSKYLPCGVLEIGGLGLGVVGVQIALVPIRQAPLSRSQLVLLGRVNVMVAIPATVYILSASAHHNTPLVCVSFFARFVA